MKRIEESILDTHNVLHNVIYGTNGEKTHLANTMMERLCHQYELSKVDIYSSSVFPYIRYDRNKNGYLIWDNHFWNLFEYYANNIEAEITHGKTEDELRRDAVSLFFIANASLLDSKPSLSKAFADCYISFFNRYGLYDGLFQQPGCSNQVFDWAFHARIYVAFHEITHTAYRKDPNAESNSKTILMQYVSEFEQPDFLYRNTVYPTIAHVVSRLKEVINNNEVDAIQEFMCDLSACQKLLDLILHAYNGNLEEEAEYTLFIALLVNNFICCLSKNERAWNHLYNIWHESSGTMEFIHAHNHNQPLDINKDITLRLDMLYIAFTRYCEEKFGRIIVLNGIPGKFFAHACNDIFDWQFVQEVIYRERQYFNDASPEHNLIDSQDKLRWNR